MGVIIGVLAVILFGYLVVNFLYPKFKVLEKFALGYLLGFGLFTLTLFIANIKGVPYKLFESSIILLLLIVVGYFLNVIFKTSRYLKPSISLTELKERFLKLSSWEKFIFSSLVFLGLSSLLINLYWPITDWDSLVLYDFRAKVFLVTGFMDEAISLGYFFGYPLLTSLSHMWIYLLGGENPMFLYTLFYLSLLVCFYYSLERAGVSRKVALIFTLLLASSTLIFEHSTWAYTNLPYTTFLLLGIVYAHQWVKEKNIRILILSALLIGFSIWTRTAEPFWMAITFSIIIIAILSRKFIHAILYPLIVVLIRNPWLNFVFEERGKRFVSEKSVVPIIGGMFDRLSIDRIILVSGYLWDNIFSKYFVLIILFLLNLSLVPGIVKNKNVPALFLITVTLFLLCMIVVGTFVMSYALKSWENIGGSAYRMSMILIPCLIFNIAISSKNILMKV